MHLPLVLAAAIAVLFAGEAPASAGPVYCPYDTTDSKSFIVDTEPDAVCLMSGTGNENGSASDAFLLANTMWAFVDDTGGNGGTMDGSLVTGAGGSGSFTVDPLVWNTYGAVALLIKSGNNAPAPSWAVFGLPQGTEGGTWEIREYDEDGQYKLKNISHAIVYGLPCAQLPCDDGNVNVDVDPPPSVPEPATMTLLAIGAAGAALARRRTLRK